MLYLTPLHHLFVILLRFDVARRYLALFSRTETRVVLERESRSGKKAESYRKDSSHPSSYSSDAVFPVNLFYLLRIRERIRVRSTNSQCATRWHGRIKTCFYISYNTFWNFVGIVRTMARGYRDSVGKIENESEISIEVTRYLVETCIWERSSRYLNNESFAILIIYNP